MFCTDPFNITSLQLIHNIWLTLKHHPALAGFTIDKDEISYFLAGAVAIKISKDGHLVNMALIFPSCDGNGKIGSCAIYGADIADHLSFIDRSKKLFGLPVESVTLENGVEQYIYIMLKDYESQEKSAR